MKGKGERLNGERDESRFFISPLPISPFKPFTFSELCEAL